MKEFLKYTTMKEHFNLTTCKGDHNKEKQMRKLPVTWALAVVFTGYSGFLHHLQLASHNLSVIQANLDMTDSMAPGKLVRHMQNPSYTYDTYLICMGLGPSISSVIDKSLLYSGPSYPSLPVWHKSDDYRNSNSLYEVWGWNGHVRV